jgi:hypothetical protein
MVAGLDAEGVAAHAGLSIEEAIMYARVATFEGGDVDELRRRNEERIADGTAGIPEGVTRAMVLEGERRLFVTFFSSREAMEASEARFEAMGDEIPESVRGRRVGVDTYEVVFDESV